MCGFLCGIGHNLNDVWNVHESSDKRLKIHENNNHGKEKLIVGLIIVNVLACAREIQKLSKLIVSYILT